MRWVYWGRGNMAIEIERKFLIKDWSEWVYSGGCEFSTTDITQYYIDKNTRVRLIVKENEVYVKKAFFTIKHGKGLLRRELEFEIKFAIKDMLDENKYPFLLKTRYTFEYKGKKWEFDDFHGANHGLGIAEIELKTENESVDKPPGLGEEVTGIEKYYNYNLAKNPYSKWEDKNPCQSCASQKNCYGQGELCNDYVKK